VKSHGWRKLGYLLLALGFGLWGAMTLGWPHGLDQGLYSWVGSVILDGGVPYQDAWEIKGPLTYLVNALAQAVLGHNEWGIRLVDLLGLAAALAAAYRVASRVGGRFGGWCAALLFFGLYGESGFWHTAQPDGWFAMLLLGVLAIAGRADFLLRGARWPAVAGALLGLGALLKPPYALFLLPLAVFLWMQRREPGTSPVRSAVAAGLGFLVPVAAVLGWLAAHAGGLAAFAEIQFQFNPSVYGAEASGAQWKALSLFVLYTPAVLACVPVFVVGVVTALARNRALGVMLALCAALAVLNVVLQAKYFSYHWHPVRAVLAVGSGMGLGVLAELWRAARTQGAEVRPLGVLLAATAVLTLGLALERPVRDVIKWGTAVAGRRSWRLYYEQVGGPDKGGAGYLAIREAADYVAAHTEPDDRVLVWGFNVLMNYLADRRSPSRFGYNLAFTRPARHPFLARYERELLADLEKSPPAYIVMSDRDQHALMERSSKDFLGDYPDLRRFVQTRFRLEAEVAGFEMWRRR
jgi:hypothetical protein